MNYKNITLSALAAAAITLTGCGGGGSTPPTTTADTVKPVITLNGPATVNLTVGGTYTEQGATVTDNVDTGLTVTISGAVDTATAGTYTVTYTATDTAGNKATKTRTVIVSSAAVTTTPGFMGLGAEQVAAKFNGGVQNAIKGVTIQPITSDITADTHWTADKVYQLDGEIAVTSGTLTIDPGTFIIATGKSSLIIGQDAKIVAEGTAAHPITFTSVEDFKNGAGKPAQWGSLVVCGKAFSNQGQKIYESMLDKTDPRGTYGSADHANDTSSSGTLSHINIFYSGIPVRPNEELNGLSLCGVGSGTTIDNIYVKDGNDDGIELWGGTVNVTNVTLQGNVGDDNLDVDYGYKGTFKNVYIKETGANESLFEMSKGAELTVDGFVAFAGPKVKKEGGINFKDGDTGGHFKNGMIIYEGTASTTQGAIYAPKAMTAAALDKISFENLTIGSTISGNATAVGTGGAAIKEKFDAGTNNKMIHMPIMSITQDITADTHWTADKVYQLDGEIAVTSGTLTIDPGTFIIATGKSSLIIGQDAKINATGIKGHPITFTSVEDFQNGTGAPGQWGSLVVLGKAFSNQGPKIYESMLDKTDTRGSYGSADHANDTSSSGTLSNVNIFYSGIPVRPNEELNGLSLPGVGSGTTINNILVTDGNDDGVEIWGGTVNLNDVMIVGQIGDDNLDVDYGYKGTVTNLYIKETGANESLFEMSKGADVTVDGFTAFAGPLVKKEGGFNFKDGDTGGNFKNGIVVYEGSITDKMAPFYAPKSMTGTALDMISFDKVDVYSEGIK